ncbi:hypothetical protein H1R20_g3142, partial [Candolleomyces eurysporus]
MGVELPTMLSSLLTRLPFLGSAAGENYSITRLVLVAFAVIYVTSRLRKILDGRKVSQHSRSIVLSSSADEFQTPRQFIAHMPSLNIAVSPYSVVGLSLPETRFTPGYWFLWKGRHELYKRFNGENFAIMPWLEGTPMIVSSNLDVMRQVAYGSHRTGFEKPEEMSEALLFWGQNLVAADGDAWRKHRRVMGPAFNSKLYQTVWTKTAEIYDQMVEGEGWTGKDSIEVPAIQKITFQVALLVISTCGFGLPFNWQEPPITEKGSMTVQQALSVTGARSLALTSLPRWTHNLPITYLKEIGDAVKQMQKFMNEQISLRKQMVGNGDVDNPDAFTMMVQANEEGDNKYVLEDDELIGNVFVLLFAGHETTAHTFAATISCLAVNPDIQQEILDHIVSVIGWDRKPTYEDYDKLDKVLAAFYEALRLFPSGHLMFRRATKDTTLRIPRPLGQEGSETIPVAKGTTVVIDMVGVQYNPRYFDEPEKFKPSRWYGLSLSDTDAYTAFSVGPRECLGRKFATVEAVSFLTLLLRDWKLEPLLQKGETIPEWKKRVLDAQILITLGVKDAPIRINHREQTKATLRDIERTGSLEQFLHNEIGIDHDAVIAYMSNGARLTNANIRELAGSQDQTIFVFNKHYLDYDLEDVLRTLYVQPQLQPPMEDTVSATPPLRHSQFSATCVRNAHKHHDFITQTQNTVHYQHESARIAATSLDAHVLVILDTFDSIATNSKRELDKQTILLGGLSADLELISQVRIHVEFMSNAVRKAIEAGEKHRTLGDYVSSAKMKTVADACRRTHEELKAKYEQTELAVSRLKEGADIIRATLNEVRLIQDADSSARRSQDILDKMTDCAATLDSPASNPDFVLQELKQLDAAHRREVQTITEIKNSYTQQSLATLRRISILNNDLLHIPPSFAALQTSFRSKNSFTHIQRLHSMLYAYGATVVEIVRRKEFSRFFYQRAQSILEVMARLSASERKRRQVYRSEVHGQLPFETKGMDDPVPTIDFSPSGNSDFSYSLERPDVDGLLRVLEDLEQYARSTGDETALNAVLDCTSSLQKLVVKMDSLEEGFDKIAERSLLSASRVSMSRKRSLDVDEQAYQELLEEFHTMEEAKAKQTSEFDEERRSMKAEIQRLKLALEESQSNASEKIDRTTKVERELAQARSHVESESTARRIVEERNQELAKDIESQRIAISRALADATEQSKAAEKLRQELSQARSEFEQVKELESRNAAKVAALLEEQGNTLRKLEEARSRGEDLESQIHAARGESEDVRQALKNTSEEKDRLLKVQASEHDRIIRDHIAEADGDRAVLERQFFELKAVQEHTERQVKDLRAEVEVANADAIGLREELQRVEHELRDAKHVERLLREDLKAGRSSQSDFERRLEESRQLIAQILDVAISFRNSHVRALYAAQTMSTLPTSGAKHGHGNNVSNLAESMASNSMRHHHNVLTETGEPSPIDPSDPTLALDVLREFDHDHFLEAIAKTGSTIRKWQKQCREYRERAKGKISFRNFAKGDLALFLPTRNSVSKPWAAFNVSFPHYFLQATGHLAEQLKTREWIVARITSISERIVDQKDESTNPYGLGDGVKYYMLEVEDWTQPSHNKRRGPSRRVTTEKPVPDPSQSTPNLQRSTSPVPLPEPSVTETAALSQQQRSSITASSATSALATLASSWGFGRRKRPESSQLTPPPESPVDNPITRTNSSAGGVATAEQSTTTGPSARALLKRF